ncbi:hypothetical protein FQN57_002998 [Myotisia sp. PD_48]|nr:hypothetical protein FQN57_002998 [Myotisia sp. PD_48]
MSSPPPQSEEFKAAVAASRHLVAKPTNDELLNLYALYKQGTQDPPFDPANAPGMFDFKGKAKFAAWKEVAEENLSAEEAQEKYIELVEQLKTKYGYDPNKDPEAVGGQ